MAGSSNLICRNKDPSPSPRFPRSGEALNENCSPIFISLPPAPGYVQSKKGGDISTKGKGSSGVDADIIVFTTNASTQDLSLRIYRISVVITPGMHNRQSGIIWGSQPGIASGLIAAQGTLKVLRQGSENYVYVVTTEKLENRVVTICSPRSLPSGSTYLSAWVEFPVSLGLEDGGPQGNSETVQRPPYDPAS
ncbi:hypothetical protein SODALDRAFT_360988 [Sodiomyces alkalinus F11]|uniref:Uncharacterized protein n=1 Tax=Sodiomyces alkalinus (strain CBS 110278 / VKM F-3762 / F11) TaxID=1314773 RepID=A0A3N2PS46_SODAK|nr:hypothetical protein SODALDRAFT_360988 [Sodiomyces alkalinus F11]ROT37290.1 hypothetical protein SODALDRAFT_360988 [Sodiomyces alkalinus F11]